MLKYLFRFIILILITNLQSCSTATSTEDFSLVDTFDIHAKKLHFKNSFLIESDPTNLSKLLYNLNLIVADQGDSKKKEIEEKLYQISEEKLKTNTEKSLFYLVEGHKSLFAYDTRTKAIFPLDYAYKLAKDTNNKTLKKLCLRALLLFYSNGGLPVDDTYKRYLAEYKLLCADQYDYLYYFHYWFNLTGQTTPYDKEKSKLTSAYIPILRGYDSLFNTFNDKKEKILLFYYLDKGNSLIRDEPEKARYYLNKAKGLFEQNEFYQHYYYLYYSGQIRISSKLKEYKKGLEYLQKAKKHISSNDSIKKTYVLQIYEADLLKELKN
ncbi:MAG: hypothetical protein HRT70_07835, partial [Flavobacteriaceae bacterium]|nr:hypothetical protein [Flavobacteriaceae bacterium]